MTKPFRNSFRLLATAALGPILLFRSLAAQTALPTRAITLEWRVDPAVANLSPIARLLVARDGKVVLQQNQDKDLRVFAPDGSSVHVGRKGSGPGEFQDMVHMGWKADTLWVSDLALRRVNFFGPDWKFVRTVPYLRELQVAVGKDSGIPFAMISPQAYYPDGSSLMLVFTGAVSKPPFWASPEHVNEPPWLAMGPDGVAAAKARGWFPKSNCSVSFKRGTGTGTGGLGIPFCASGHFDLSGDGKLIATAQVVEKGTPAYRVVAARADGAPGFDRVFPYTPVPIPRTVVDSSRRVNVERTKDEALRGAYEKMVYPVAYPPLRTILAGRDGTVWIQHYAVSPKAPGVWTVLSAAGAPLFSVSIPAGASIYEAELGRIWCVVTNEDGDEGIAVYKVAAR